MKKLAAALAVGALLIAAPNAFAGSGNGVSSSHGANAHGNAVSSGATPQPQ
jgi:predicted small secreted protein